MGEATAIQWTTHTFNPWIGCDKVSAGCKNCYAENSPPVRQDRGKGLELWGPKANRRKTGAANWKLPERWNRSAEEEGSPDLVFCASLADVFEDHPDVAPWRRELFALIERTPNLTWQLLTKRPENLLRMLPSRWIEHPRPNVWLGVSVENQEAAEARIPRLLAVPARLHFLSCEPLLAPVDLRAVRWGRCKNCEHSETLDALDATMRCPCWGEVSEPAALGRIGWVIVGGESGPRARPFDLAWASSLIGQCRAAEVPVFLKQLGARPRGEIGGKIPRSWQPSAALGRRDEWVLRDAHGGDPEEWPEGFRVREMPIGY